MEVVIRQRRFRKRAAIVRLALFALLAVAAVATLVWMLQTKFAPSHDDVVPAADHTAVPANPPRRDAPPPVKEPQRETSTPGVPDSVASPPINEVPGSVSSSSTTAITGRGDTADLGLSSPKLIVPVAGVRPSQLVDTYDAARAGGRVHNAIDILAPQGTPVRAAANGTVIKLFQSNLGGTTLYQLDNNQTTVYYYAHLQRYADGINEGSRVRQGDTIAYVGDTGDAGPGNYHLHFGITVVSDPKHYWGGTDINPYPLLRGDPSYGGDR